MRTLFGPTTLGLAAAALLAGCAGGVGPQVVIDPKTSELRVPARVGSVMLRDISLPAYAQASEISVRSAGGTLVEKKGAVWADEPARAMTGAMVRNLSSITGAQVAAEPWPLEGYPDVELTVRVEHMFARDDGSITLVGYYAIRREHGRSLIRQFDITRPPVAEAPDDLARVHEAAWSDLAERIARDL
ncbi:MAG: membrane integrity-associated transporter subunit PqiC [Maritimibacter sp.]|nr:membrane integrity-associated transporter subunit PqiC [Maritimibacter sp.]